MSLTRSLKDERRNNVDQKMKNASHYGSRFWLLDLTSHCFLYILPSHSLVLQKGCKMRTSQSPCFCTSGNPGYSVADRPSISLAVFSQRETYENLLAAGDEDGAEAFLRTLPREDAQCLREEALAPSQPDATFFS